MKKKVAIVGSGIAGMGCAHYLQDIYDVTIFEKNDYLGGHTHTHVLEEQGQSFTLDTGFMVFNNETYPRLLALFEELGVEKQKSDMSFSVWNQLIDLQYGSSNFWTLFAQKRNLFSRRFWKLLLDIKRFFSVAHRDLATIHTCDQGLQEYCLSHGLSQYFIDNFLVPMSAAIWSTPHEKVYTFPIALLLPFLHNHGLLGVNDQFQWYTVTGGSSTYIERICARENIEIHLEEPVTQVAEHPSGVELITSQDTYTFDYVVLATHAPTSLQLVPDLTQEKKDLLAAFTYTPNTAVIHTDPALMPPSRRARASWNQLVHKDDGSRQASTTYWINRLQNPDVTKDYFVSINPYLPIDPTQVIKEIAYEHPLFTLETNAVQKNLPQLNTNTNIYFTGSYFRYGFHEDGLMSALSVVDILRAHHTS